MDKVKTFLKNLPRNLALWLIRFYQVAISPILGPSCRFQPTCSEYGRIAIQRYGFKKGVILTAKRLAKCRPGGPHGYDPVP